MEVKTLSQFPSLERVLSEPLKRLISSSIVMEEDKKSINAILNIYSVFIDIQSPNLTHIVNYTAINVVNNKDKFRTQLLCIIGFIYSELHISSIRKYQYAKIYFSCFSKIAKEKLIPFSTISISKRKISEDTQECIEQYQASTKNINLLKYYRGWQVEDKEGHTHHLYLAKILDTYGVGLTQTIHNNLQNYAKKHNYTSIKKPLGLIVELFNVFIQIKPTIVSLKTALLSQNVNKFFELVFGMMISQNQIKGNNIKLFIQGRWYETIYCYTKAFIDTGAFEEPLFPIITPLYKTPKKSVVSVSTGGGISNNEISKERLLSKIPLSIADHEALDIIRIRINNDLEHVKQLTQLRIDRIKKYQRRNEILVSEGDIKFYSKVTDTKKFKIGAKYMANTLSTFYKYQWDYKGSSFEKFLGFENKMGAVNTELNLPLKENVLCFLSQLVMEHPEIVPSWFVDWELFDKSHKQTGFKKSGLSYVAISNKNRKGVENAQTEVVLNERSKKIVEALIKHTEIARLWLKSQRDDSWRYMCIYTNGINSSPRRISVTGGKRINVNAQFKKLIGRESFTNNGKVILTKEEAFTLAGVINLRPIRSSRALQVYLDTLSVRAMSDALGHKKYNHNLLSSYLPDALLDFFNNRWVRIFQNAIIYQAMKDSPYLFNAIDFTEDKLEDFLNNHSLRELPKHIIKGKTIASNNVNAEPEEIKNGFNELVITLSVPLLQVLIAIVSIIESANPNEIFPSVIKKWYETAVFLIKQLSMENTLFDFITDDIKSIYQTAKKNPISIEKMKECLCHQK